MLETKIAEELTWVECSQVVLVIPYLYENRVALRSIV